MIGLICKSGMPELKTMLKKTVHCLYNFLLAKNICLSSKLMAWIKLCPLRKFWFYFSNVFKSSLERKKEICYQGCHCVNQAIVIEPEERDEEYGYSFRSVSRIFCLLPAVKFGKPVQFFLSSYLLHFPSSIPTTLFYIWPHPSAWKDMSRIAERPELDKFSLLH